MTTMAPIKSLWLLIHDKAPALAVASALAALTLDSTAATATSSNDDVAAVAPVSSTTGVDATVSIAHKDAVPSVASVSASISFFMKDTPCIIEKRICFSVSRQEANTRVYRLPAEI